MPKFDYVALDGKGNERKGTIEAEDFRAASATLREEGFFVVEIDEVESAGGLNQDVDLGFLSDWRSVSSQELIFFFKQLTFMLRSGLPMLQTLQLSRGQVASGKLRRVIGDVITDIENGMPLSQALSQHPKVFPPLTVNLIVAGERTGELDQVLDRLADHLEKKAALKMQTINAMIYPVLVVVAAIGVFIFLVVKIIPAFGKFFAGRGQGLPQSTQFLLDLSAFMIEYGLYFVAAALLCTLLVIIMHFNKAGRYHLHNLLLRLPIIGKLLTTSIMAQLNWSLSMMLRSGLTALDALKVAGQVISNRVISDKLYAASDLILSGKDISTSLQHPRIPTVVTQMIAVGERSGTLDHVLQQLGNYYQERLELGIKRLSAMIEPALILVIGVMVGFVYYAFFQALFQIAKT